MTLRWLEMLKLEFRDPHLAIAATFAVLILLLYGWIPPLDPYIGSPHWHGLASYSLVFFGHSGRECIGEERAPQPI